MRSKIYSGTITHRRLVPKEHSFSFSSTMALLDLDEVDAVAKLHPLVSFESPNLVSWRRRDYLGDPKQSLSDSLRDLAENRLGRRPTGPISMLGHLRTSGWLFNPIVVYYLYGSDGVEVESVVLHVTNTPWGESHSYVFESVGTHTFEKELHVSPFLEMNQQYRLNINMPGDELSIVLNNFRDAKHVFSASHIAKAEEISRASLQKLVSRPFATMRVSAGIYAHALALYLKRVPFQPHPKRDSATN